MLKNPVIIGGKHLVTLAKMGLDEALRDVREVANLFHEVRFRF
jgi:hypothetical protein